MYVDLSENYEYQAACMKVYVRNDKQRAEEAAAAAAVATAVAAAALAAKELLATQRKHKKLLTAINKAFTSARTKVNIVVGVLARYHFLQLI